jgi:hypothetical protein
VLLDEGVLQKQRLELRVRDDGLDLAEGPQQGLGLGALAAGPEIGGDALSQGPRLADVEEFALVSPEQVDARGIREILRGAKVGHGLSVNRLARGRCAGSI